MNSSKLKKMLFILLKTEKFNGQQSAAKVIQIKYSSKSEKQKDHSN